MSDKVVYLVSGANRGIGLGLVKVIAEHPDSVVFAGARNPSGAKDLRDLVQMYPSRVHIVKLTACDKIDNEAAVSEVQKIAGKLDVLIANAGICLNFGPALETSMDHMREHYEVNVTGPSYFPSIISADEK